MMLTPCKSASWGLSFLLLSTIGVRADNEMIKAASVLSVVTTDWNADGAMDRALLLAGEGDNTDQADLMIYLSTPDNTLQLAAHKKNIVWRGALWGTQPKLELSGKDSLLIHSGNEAIGRNRWNQKLTIAYRNQQFIMAGYTYNEYDTLEPNAQGIQCDVNLITGNGLKNGKKITLNNPANSLSDWEQDGILPICQN